jgi:hypothetical protein
LEKETNFGENAMRPTGCRIAGVAVVMLALTGRATVQSMDPAQQDPSEAIAHGLLDQAIKAVGGSGPLAKISGMTANVKGIIHFQGDRNLPATMAVSVQSFDRFRLQVDTLQGRPFEVALIANGPNSWFKSNKRLEASKETLFETGLAHDLYALQLTQLLLPLKDKGFRLASAGEIKIGQHLAPGFRVSHAGRPDVNIYLDKETGLPIRCELRFRAEKVNQEYVHEILLQDYKEVDGVKFCTKIIINRDEAKVFSADLTDLKLHEKLDARIFAEP